MHLHEACLPLQFARIVFGIQHKKEQLQIHINAFEIGVCPAIYNADHDCKHPDAKSSTWCFCMGASAYRMLQGSVSTIFDAHAEGLSQEPDKFQVMQISSRRHQCRTVPEATSLLQDVDMQL